jgi:hypothetical protein
MPDDRFPFEYSIVRVVPSLERGERINAGVIVHSRPARYLGCRTSLDRARLAAISPGTNAEDVDAHLLAMERIARGDPAGGPIAALSAPERFHWLVSPASTIVQPSRIHTGLTADPDRMLEHLFRSLVLPVGSGADEDPARPDAGSRS